MVFLKSLLQDFQSFMVTKRLPAYDPLQLPAPVNRVSELVADKHNATVESRTSGVSANALFLPHVMYLNQSTPVLSQPYYSYDVCTQWFAYGDAVTVTEYHNEYALVQRANHVGWVKKDYLCPRKDQVWPVFTPGRWYSYDDETTQRTRALIKDDFFAGAAHLSLQPAEYVSVILRQDNRTITWPVRTGRQPGIWHHLLRGVKGIHISVHPLADSLMEWTDQSGVGHLGYVKEVMPDNTVLVDGIGILEDGVLESVRLPVNLWREWRPVFIAVS